MDPQEAFVTRLRRHRQRDRISLEEMAAATCVKRELLDALENNNLSEWPRGLYARAWIRAYATAVGLDPTETVDEFCRLFPNGDRRAQPIIREIAAIVDEPSQYRDEFSHHEDRRRPAPRINVITRPAWHAPITHTARTLWMRVSAVAGPHLRTRRTPREST